MDLNLAAEMTKDSSVMRTGHKGSEGKGHPRNKETPLIRRIASLEGSVQAQAVRKERRS